MACFKNVQELRAYITIVHGIVFDLSVKIIVRCQVYTLNPTIYAN